MRVISKLKELLRKDRYFLVFLGLWFAAACWVVDSMVYAFLLHKDNFLSSLANPEQIPTRLGIALLFIALSSYAQYTVNSSRQVEDALRDSESRFRNLVDSAMDIIFTLSPDGKFTSLNPAFENITGWSRNECVGKEFLPLIHPDDMLSARQIHYRVMRGEALPTHELRILSKSGEYVIAEVELSAQVQDGVVVGALGIARDVTERKRTEETLHISHQFLQIVNQHTELVPLLEDCVAQIKTFTGCSAVGIRILSDEGRLPYKAHVGFPAEFLAAESTLNFESEGPMCIKVIKGHTEHGRPCFTEGGAFYLNGTTRFLIRIPQTKQKDSCTLCNEFGFESVALVPVRLRDRVVGLIHVADPREDVIPMEVVETLEQVAIQLGMALQRVRAEEALRESEKRYRLLAENAKDVIWTMNMDLKFTYYSPSVTRLRGYTMEEATAQTLDQTLTPASLTVVLDALGEALALEGTEAKDLTKSWVLQLEVTCKNRPSVWTEATITFVRDSDGMPMEILGVTRDITERKRIEQMKSDFVSLVSHQLKTPEGMITGYIDYMLEGLTGELNEEQRKTLTEMRAVSQSNYRLITDLLNVSRIERGVISVEIEAVGLGQIIDQSLRDYREKIADKGLSLRVEGPGDMITVLADKEKTVQALSNLINNAIKFTKEGSIAIRTSSDDRYGVVEVSDTGIGMSPDVMGRLFNKDRVLSKKTSAEEGAGLGLYIAKQFMTLQHGDISVTSEVGKGTSFYIKVPLIEGAGHREATNARRTKGHSSDSRGQSSVPTNIP